MLNLGWPWAFAALALPFIAALALPRAPALQGEALRFPFFETLAALAAEDRPTKRGWRRLLGGLAFVLLVTAAARPQVIGEPLSLPLTGRDLMIAVDVSTSMQVLDLAIDGIAASRLQAVQHLGGAFAERRVGDRVGLILFGTNPYVQTPLTFDRAMVRQQLGEAMVGLAGGRTALGDAIGLAVKRLRERPETARVLVLITDGSSTAGRADPSDAAHAAARSGVRIYTVGVGSEISEARQRAMGSNDLGLSLDESGLRAIADATGGRYFRGSDLASLAGIYEELDRLEPSAQEADIVRPVRELYPWPLAAALGLALLLAVASAWREPLARLRESLRGTLARWLSSIS